MEYLWTIFWNDVWGHNVFAISDQSYSYIPSFFLLPPSFFFLSRWEEQRTGKGRGAFSSLGHWKGWKAWKNKRATKWHCTQITRILCIIFNSMLIEVQVILSCSFLWSTKDISLSQKWERRMPGYYDVITNPVHLEMMMNKLSRGEYCKGEFQVDLNRMYANCRKFYSNHVWQNDKSSFFFINLIFPFA